MTQVQDRPEVAVRQSVEEPWPPASTEEVARRRRRRSRRPDNFDSPPANIRAALQALAVAASLVLLLGSQGIVQTANGMPSGPIQSITLFVGDAALSVDEFVHLTWVWDGIQAALGHQQQPSTPPLLNTNPTPTPVSALRPGTGTQTRNPPRGVTRRQKSGGHHSHGPVWPPLPTITKSRPLPILITGDSLLGYMGPELLNEAHAQGSVTGWTDIHDGTGLTRPDFVDWSVVAHQQTQTYHPDAVVVMIGGNDFQNMTLPNRFFHAGTPSWTREYQRRAEIVMKAWIQGGVRRVYWLSMPPARDPSWAYDDYKIDLALRRAARRVPGVHYVNVLRPITNHGHYSDYVNVNGVPTLIREQDGVHLNIQGSDVVAREVEPIIKREWHFGWSHVDARAHRGRARHGSRQASHGHGRSAIRGHR